MSLDDFDTRFTAYLEAYPEDADRISGMNSYEDGETLESPLSLTADVTYDRGQQLRIRYVPGVRDMVRPA